MAREAEQKQIDDCIYEIYCMHPKVALKVLTWLTKMVLEPLGAVSGAFAGGGKDDGKVVHLSKAKFAPDALNRALASLAERMDESQIQEMIDELLKNVLLQAPGDKGPRKILFERDFQGRVFHLLKVVKASLEVNFADFFDGASGLEGLLERIPRSTP